MKILFSGVDFSSRTGPNTFAYRLADRLAKNGHILADPHDYDIALVFIEPSHKLDPRKPFIQRLDGIWSKPSEFLWKNKSILEGYKRADGIIFQSDFNKSQITKWWGEPKSYKVIHNGIDLEVVKESLPGFLKLRSEYDMMFVCSANWHSQKRLKENIRCFRYLKKKYPNSCLIVLGNNPDFRPADPHIFYTGSLPHDQCLKLFAVSNWMIHLAWGDHCPNTVIESLSQGTPVICSEVGGTKEIVGKNGIIIPEKERYDFTLKDYDNPPDLPDDFGGMLETLPKLEVDPSHLDINKVADSYIQFMEKFVK